MEGHYCWAIFDSNSELVWGLYAVMTQEYVLVFERKFCLVVVFIQIIASWIKCLRNKGLDIALISWPITFARSQRYGLYMSDL